MPFEVNDNYLEEVILKNQTEEALLEFLYKTKHFERILLKKQPKAINLYCTQNSQNTTFSLGANKKNFLGFLIKSRLFNVSDKLDMLTFKIHHDFPFFNPDLMIF